MKTRSEILAEITESLSRGLMGQNSYLKRVGNIFFRQGDCGCVQRDDVYYGSRRYGLNFELMSMDWYYFTGTKAHALALLEAFGGRAYPSEYTSVAEPMDLWIWEGVRRYHPEDEGTNRPPIPLEFEAVKAVLFDEA